jgi:hypothetical protein
VREDEYSHKGIDRATQVDKKLIESNEYRRKFDNATDNPKVNKVLYESAKEILFDRSGTHYESMYWINGDTGDVLVKAEYMGKIGRYTGARFYNRVVYDDAKLKKQLCGHLNIITIHNHPNSTAPSPSDLNSAFKRHYLSGYTVSHNGTVYEYKANDETNITAFDMAVSEYLDDGFDINNAQLLAYKSFSKYSNISVREVLK